MVVLDCIRSVELALRVVEEEYKNNPTDKLLKEKQALEARLKRYLDSCKQMGEIENRLYYKIAYEGKGIMRACNEVADENYYNDVKPSNAAWIYSEYIKKIKKNLEPR